MPPINETEEIWVKITRTLFILIFDANDTSTCSWYLSRASHWTGEELIEKTPWVHSKIVLWTLNTYNILRLPFLYRTQREIYCATFSSFLKFSGEGNNNKNTLNFKWMNHLCARVVSRNKFVWTFESFLWMRWAFFMALLSTWEIKDQTRRSWEGEKHLYEN